MEQLQDKENILESKVKKETYLLRSRRRFYNTKHFIMKKRYKEEENELNRRVVAILKRFGLLKEGER
ncbi:MAG: hypothetical protein NTY73_02715 [Candidatus Micrarchaeota archaeon]|nr:hypothetical protein [Candidatus Micrarchaeota archaeon]